MKKKITKGGYKKGKSLRKGRNAARERHDLTINCKMPWGIYEGYTLRQVIEGDWNYWSKHRSNLHCDDSVWEYELSLTPEQKRTVSISPSGVFLQRREHPKKKIEPLSLDTKMWYGKLKGLTIREVIDQHYPYWRTMREDHHLRKDVKEYERAIREKIKHLSETLRRD